MNENPFSSVMEKAFLPIAALKRATPRQGFSTTHEFGPQNPPHKHYDSAASGKP
jgi:hypothetical protein